MTNLIQAAVFTLFAASTAQAQQAVQWRVSDGGNGHWYGVEFQFRLWADAKIHAESLGGHLVTTTSQSELDVIRPLINNTLGADYWMGASRRDIASPWLWVTGEPFSFTRWEPGEPDNGPESICLEVIGRPESPGFGMWNDETYYAWGDGNYSLIEWSTDCNGDGVVDYGQCLDGTLPDYNGNNIPDCCERGEACVVGNYPVQWRMEGGGNGHWYQFVIGETTSWDAARISATGRGGYLASVRSQAESDFIVAVCSNTSGWISFSFYWLGPWLGGYQPPNSPEPAGNWTWISGEPWDWTKWWAGSSEPNNGCSGHEDYVVMLTQAPESGPSGWWNDAAYPDACGGPNPKSSLVEWSADCNGDGVVDFGQILQGQLADLNTDGVPDVCQQPTCADADLYRDFNVNGADLGILLSQWGPITPLTESDLNGDGVVDGADLGLLLSFWGACP